MNDKLSHQFNKFECKLGASMGKNSCTINVKEFSDINSLPPYISAFKS